MGSDVVGAEGGDAGPSGGRGRGAHLSVRAAGGGARGGLAFGRRGEEQ